MARETMVDSQIKRHAERILAKTSLGVTASADVAAMWEQPEARTPHGWFSFWVKLAGRTRQQARTVLERGDPAAASRAYLRASEYYRAAAAPYWPGRGDAAIADALRLHAACFRASLDIDGPVYQPFSLASSGVILEGYLTRSRSAHRDAALLMCFGPVDGTPAEQYLLAGRAALERGWAVALVDPQALGEIIAAQEEARHDPFARLTAAFTEFVGVRPAERAIACIGSSVRLDAFLGRYYGAPEVFQLSPSAQELSDLRRRIRAPAPPPESPLGCAAAPDRKRRA